MKGLGAIRAKIGPTSDVDKIFSKMYSQYVLFRNKYKNMGDREGIYFRLIHYIQYTFNI
jgi:hypothetical protein